MVKLASPVAKSSPLSIVSAYHSPPSWRSSQWLVSAPTLPNKFQFVDSKDIAQSPARDQIRKKKNASSNQSCSAPLWKVVQDGLFAFLFLAIIFAASGWMFYGYSLEIASVGDLQILEFVQGLF